MKGSYRPPVVSVSSEQDDVVKSKNQHFPLPEDYRFIREDRSFRLWAGFLWSHEGRGLSLLQGGAASAL